MVTALIRKWAKDRGLDTAEPRNQLLKLAEEFGELCQAEAKGKGEADIKDALGDMYVVMTIYAMQKELLIEDCIKDAYNEIKDRKGKMINGVFIKQEDM